jgi:hypothetical protein
MSQSQCGMIHGQHCNFSMDQGERAMFEYLVAACHLLDIQCHSRKQKQSQRITDILTCLCRLKLDVAFLMLSQTQN